MPLKPPLARPATSPSVTVSHDETPSKILIVAEQDDRLRLLEQTFSTYVLALRSRGGNIVGRTLRVRNNADKAMVNELYNVLLEDPGKIQSAAEAPVDVLFVAFETFILRAWRDYAGPIIESMALKLMQSKFDTMLPGDFGMFFRRSLTEMSSHNRRALGAIVRLLADLLDASGNDGDRGALTAAFAEVMTEDGDPMQHVSLLDRLVIDLENLFDDSARSSASHDSTPSRPLSANTGSVSSNASSFRRRFGFGLHRENSKTEGESKVSTLIRTLSKGKSTSEPESQFMSVSKASLFRHRSIDTDSRVSDLLRPASRDRPTVYGAFPSDERIRRPGTAHNDSSTLLTTIGELSPNDGRSKHKKKRRSSLSDLPPTPTKEPLVASTHPPQQVKLTPSTPVQLRPQLEMTPQTRQMRPRTSPTPGIPTRLPQPPQVGPPTRIGSPLRSISPTQPSPPTRKENIVPRPTLTERAINKKTDGPGLPTYRTKRRSDTISSIPQPKGLTLKERPMSAHAPAPTPKRPRAWSSPKPQKLRMQNPQKVLLPPKV
jgi:hypothetical protein